MKTLRAFFLGGTTCFCLMGGLCGSAVAQVERDDRATVNNFKGIQYTNKDSTFYANFRFRMQSRLKYSSLSGQDLGVDNWEARIRRLRLRMDGYLYNPKLRYSFQLAFTRGDQDFDDTGVPNLVRDAVIFYHFTDEFYVGFGLNKLPGNRQRVTSSGSQQFAERSLVNARFNVDRDFGLKAYWSKQLGGTVPVNIAAAITTGEGRVANSTDKGLAYTARAEMLPLGEFTNDGDYFEGDLERESSPKLSVGGGLSYNFGTRRTGGQIGKFTADPLDLRTQFLDAIFKYAGWAYQLEYMKLDVDDPLTTNTDGELLYAFKGSGVNQQLSYLLDSEKGYELAGRYTLIRPDESLAVYERDLDVLELGLTRYFRAHKLKLQLNAAYTVQDQRFGLKQTGNHWGATFQIELGI